MARVYVGRQLMVRQSDLKLEGYVYFMRAAPDGLVKIGWSASHPDARLKRIRATSPSPIMPLALMRGGLAVEGALHERFAEFWSHGEWFAPTPELLEHIAAIGEPWPDPVTQVRPLRTASADLALALSGEERQEAIERDREHKRLVKWAKGRSTDRYGVKRTFFEWSEMYRIPLAMMETWRDEGFRVDLIGYYAKLRESEQQAIPSP